ncbi:MAG: DNA primase [Bacteroidota bacterium]|nr:DNA primase [Bacteroidota bacterium]
MIDSSTIGRILDAANISDVVSEFVTLKKRGVNQLGLCPFHNEKTPSFTVSPAKGIFKCFGCGKGGNSVNFIMELEQLSYPDALRWLAKKYHIEFDEKEETQEEKLLKDERESMMIVSAFAQKYFSRYLLKENEGRTVGLSYLRERGIRDDMITKFELGFCPDGKDLFTQAAQREGYKMEFLEKTGLTIKRDDWVRDRFGGRVIFPVHNVAGRVIAFGGRTLTNDKKVAKYLNSPESEIYHKGKTLYGIYQAKRDITRLDKCYLVEGYTDVLAFHQAGIENVVASSGTALTSEQIRLIRRFTFNLTIIYDGDAAGISAAKRGIDIALQEGMSIKLVLLPKDEDPDSFVNKNNASYISQFIKDNEHDFIKFLVSSSNTSEEIRTNPTYKVEKIKEFTKLITLIPEKLVREEYLKFLAISFNIDIQILFTEQQRIMTNVDNSILNKPKPSLIIEKLFNNEENKFSLEEDEILRILLKYFHQEAFEFEDEETHQLNKYSVGYYVLNELHGDGLVSVNHKVRSILLAMEENLGNKEFNPIRFFTQHPDNEISQYASNLLAEKYTESKRWGKSGALIETESEKLYEIVPMLIKEYKLKNVKIMQEKLGQQINEASKNNDEERTRELQTQYQKLNEVINALSKLHGFRAIT